LRGEHRARARGEQGRCESLHSFTAHGDPTRRATCGQHDESRVEPKRRKLPWSDEAVVAIAGRDGKRRTFY